MNNPSTPDLYRKIATDLLGAQISFHNVHVPGNASVQDVILDTKGKLALAVSQVDVYSHLIEGTPYYNNYHFDSSHTPLTREPDEIFAFRTRPGYFPALSIVLPNHTDGIAVLKKVITKDGDEFTWSRVLEDLGIEQSQYQAFCDVVDGILTTRENATVQLEKIPSIPTDDMEYIPQPTISRSNLAGTSKLNSKGKKLMKDIL